jgi:hypothetical protein
VKRYRILNIDTGEVFADGIYGKRTAIDSATGLHERYGHSYIVIEISTETVFRTEQSARAA